MPYTNFPDGITSMGVPVVGGIGGVPLTGSWYFVNATRGSDGNEGTADAPFASLDRAYSLAVAGQNDVIVLQSAVTLPAQLAWAKDQVHLIGMGAPSAVTIGPAVLTTVFTPMVLVTADNCLFQNFTVVENFTQTATAAIAWEDQGTGNAYSGVRFSGMASATASTSKAQAGSASVLLTGGGNRVFNGCVFGEDVQTRGAANASLRMRSAASRDTFNDCVFPANAGAAGVLAMDLNASGAVGGAVNMNRCDFYNISSTAMTAAIAPNAAQGGPTRLVSCAWGPGVTDLTAADSAVTVLNAPAASDDAGGQMVPFDTTP